VILTLVIPGHKRLFAFLSVEVQCNAILGIPANTELLQLKFSKLFESFGGKRNLIEGSIETTLRGSKLKETSYQYLLLLNSRITPS
jgi:hypothetical protein